MLPVQHINTNFVMKLFYNLIMLHVAQFWLSICDSVTGIIHRVTHCCRFPQLQFDYKDPERGFDRKSVHGLVVRLVAVKDPSTATALEVSAGGKVSNSFPMNYW